MARMARMMMLKDKCLVEREVEVVQARNEE